MADTERTKAELLAIFADGQPERSINPQDMRDFVVSTLVVATVKVIREESDFPTPELAPDGVLRIPLDITAAYIFDIGELSIATPFQMPERLLGFERVRFFSPTNTTLIYTGTDSLFWGRNSSSLEIDKVDLVAQDPGTICFDMVAGPNVVNFTLFNTAIIDFDVGFTSGYAVFGRRLGIDRSRGPFHIHDAPRCLISRLRISSDTTGSTKPNFLFTGGDETTLTVIKDVLSEVLEAGQSHFAIDSGFVAKQTSFQNFGFNDDVGRFFEAELDGNIITYQNIMLLISHTTLTYENDGNDNVLVTTSGLHNIYVGLIVDHINAGVYTGQHLVIKALDNSDQYVIDADYDGDETGGSLVGIGTRVTTAAAHKIDKYRVTTIVGSTNYNGVGIEVLNTSSNSFDIATVFAGDDATGNFSTTSLTEKDVSVSAVDNGDLPNSKHVGEVDLSLPSGLDILDSGDAPTQITSVSWTTELAEEFTGLDGVLTYIGIHPSSVLVQGTATIENSGGGADTLALSIARNNTPIMSSEGTTANNTPTQVSSISVVDLVTDDEISLYVENKTSSTDVTVYQATLITIGM